MCRRAIRAVIVLLWILVMTRAKIVIDNESISAKNIMESACAKDSYDKYMMEVNNLKGFNNELRTKINGVNDRLGKASTTFKNAIDDVKNLISSPTNIKTITSCSETLLHDGDSLSGVYRLNVPNSGLTPFSVLCLKDPHNGPAWTVLQRRQDGSIDFYRGWDDYVNGFGNLYGEFWLGLDRINAITASQKHELWIQFDDFEGGSYYAKYNEFLIGDRKTKYEMLKLGTFYGTTSDSLNTHVNQKFTTKDSDNDNDGAGNCAVTYTGAWWYRSCFNCNLNGRYLYEQNKTDAAGKVERGIEWYKFRPYYTLKYVHIAVRPVKD